MKRVLVPFFLLLLLSCTKDDVQLTTIDEQITVWLDSMNIAADRDDSGIYYYPEILNLAGNTASQGDVVAIYYELSDLDGNVIASHRRTDGDSLIFKHAVSAVYPVGIDICTSLMRVGETYHFIFPPSQAYSGLKSGAINPNLIAHLRLEVVGLNSEATIFSQEVTDIDTYIINENLNDTIANPLNTVEKFPASGISTKRLSAGNGARPLNGDTIILNYTTKDLNDMEIEGNNGFQFYFGSNDPRPLIPGFEFGVSMMQTNERSLIMIPSSQAYRESALIIPFFIAQDLVDEKIVPDYVSKVKPYTTLLFEVNRLD